MKNLFKFALLVITILLVGLSFASKPTVVSVQADNDNVCPGGDNSWSGNWYKDEKSPFGVTVTGNYIIDRICVKGGNNLIYYTSNGNDECWSVSGINSQSASAAKIGNGNTCKNISHASFHKVLSQDQPTPTPTEEPTPTDTQDDPTPTPTEEPTPTDTQDDPTPTPTDKPSNGNDDDKKDDKNEAVGGVSTSEKQGEVLGVNTLPQTGNFASVLATIEQALGIAFLSLGAMIYGKKKSSKKNK